MYDGMLTAEERGSGRGVAGLPTQMEVRPLIMPAADLSQPFQASPEFPGAVAPNGLRVPGQAAALDAKNDGQNPFQFLAPFKDGMDQVSRLAADSEALSTEAALGGDVDLHDVMIAAEKAGVAMQLTLQVRNKLVEAYQDVMRMQV
jgi:flagellar hook-basal body complex protein FliE